MRERFESERHDFCLAFARKLRGFRTGKPTGEREMRLRVLRPPRGNLLVGKHEKKFIEVLFTGAAPPFTVEAQKCLDDSAISDLSCGGYFFRLRRCKLHPGEHSERHRDERLR